MQPNSLNFLKFPLIAMFWNMIFYMSPPMCAHLRCVRCCLAFFTDCGFFSAEPKLDMVECGQAHEDPPWATILVRGRDRTSMASAPTCPVSCTFAGLTGPLRLVIRGI